MLSVLYSVDVPRCKDILFPTGPNWTIIEGDERARLEAPWRAGKHRLVSGTLPINQLAAFLRTFELFKFDGIENNVLKFSRDDAKAVIAEVYIIQEDECDATAWQSFLDQCRIR